MIRLDGNSLAAFRGAGVAGTVQSVAGCELFGAARVPSWASPYSAAATAALKAQFPTQWPTIRDYGLAHPALVPFINEDPMLVMSLIEGLGWRKITSDGYCYIKTGVIASPTIGFEGDAEFLDVSNSFTGYCVVDKAVNNEAFGISWWSNLWHTWWGSNSQKNGGRINKNVVYHISQMQGSALITGSDGSTWSATNSGTPTIIQSELYFPTARRNNSEPTSGAKLIAPNFKIYDGGVLIRHFVPCKHNNEDSWLDIVNAEFHPKVGSGSFTISESPA